MPELKRRTPCAQCPFRKTAPQGYLGASSAQEFLDATLGEAEMPCHMSISYLDPQWKETQYEHADLCVGALQFLNNHHKLPRNRKLSAACGEVGQSDAIIERPEHFMSHHDNAMNRHLVETAQLAEPGVTREYS